MKSHLSSLSPLSTVRRLVFVLRCDCRGTPIIEMALLLPLMLMLMMGIVVYGQYFLIAHSVQQAVNDGGRAALVGLNAEERQSIALRTIDRDLGTLRDFDRQRRTILVEESGREMTVHLAYTLPKDSFLRTSLVPVPSDIIRSVATFELQEH